MWIFAPAAAGRSDDGALPVGAIVLLGPVLLAVALAWAARNRSAARALRGRDR